MGRVDDGPGPVRGSEMKVIPPHHHVWEGSAKRGYRCSVCGIIRPEKKKPKSLITVFVVFKRGHDQSWEVMAVVSSSENANRLVDKMPDERTWEDWELDTEIRE